MSRARGTLTASATRYVERKTRGKNATVDQGWQSTAWRMYKSVPEVRFAANYVGNAMSGAVLYAGRRADDGTIEPAPLTHRAAEIVAQIAGGPDGQSKLLGSFGRHLSVPGEGWIVVRPNSEVLSPDAPEDGHDWRVLSTREVRQGSNRLTVEIDGEDVEIPAGDAEAMDPDGPVAIRVWEPDPERSIEADSPVRSALDLLEELQLLNAAVKAIARSRLIGRGVLLIPKGTRFPTSSTANGDAEDDVIEIFMQVAETAIRDPESAAATVPIVLEVPADSIPDFKHLTFESNFDELALKLREEAVRRFAIGLDIPAEILLGLGDSNHWSAWALTSEAIRMGIEPKLATVAYALTQQWLRPLLQAERVEDWHRWLVWYDTAPLRVRTNRAETALKAHEAGVISDAALRRETGFEESDAPTPEEERERETDDPAADDDNTDEGEPTTPVTALPVDQTNNDPPAVAAAARPADGLLVATDLLIWAALSNAGRRMKHTRLCPRSERETLRDVELDAVHTRVAVDREGVEQFNLLEGAWVRVPDIAGRYGLDPDCLTASLDMYTRELIAAGVVHEYERLPVVVGSCNSCDDMAVVA